MIKTIRKFLRLANGREYIPTKDNPVDIAERMKAKLDELNFDFNRFTVERLKECIEKHKRRKIFLLGAPLTTDLDGFWLSDAELPYEYIVYDTQVEDVFQIHTQLHELGHVVIHEPEKITTQEFKSILQDLRNNIIPPRIQELSMNRSSDEEMEGLESSAKRIIEIEAETFAMLVQEQVIHHARMKELTQAVSANQEADDFLHSLGLN